MNNRNKAQAVGDAAAAIEVKHLYKKYSKDAPYAVEDVNFKIEKGEIVGLLGHNGAGKSTTLKCLTGMLPFSEGEISVMGYSMKTRPVKAKSKFGFVTDNHAVFQKLTGFQYIMFMADVFGVSEELRRERFEKLQEIFMLGDSVYNIISSYSHGMKQKICMMGSLIHEPDVWILDEPMLGLDPAVSHNVTAFMKSYVDEGHAILFSSHNLDVVNRVCSRAVVINSGRVIADMPIDGNQAEELQRYFLGQNEGGAAVSVNPATSVSVIANDGITENNGSEAVADE